MNYKKEFWLLSIVSLIFAGGAYLSLGASPAPMPFDCTQPHMYPCADPLVCDPGLNSCVSVEDAPDADMSSGNCKSHSKWGGWKLSF